MRRMLLVGAAALGAIWAAPASAATVIDPPDDFLASFIGDHDADLDVLSFSVEFDSTTSNFLLGATLNGAIDPTRAGLYAIGVNTGTGPAAPFGPIGAPNVRFNQVIAIFKDGTGVIGPNALAPGAVTISGNQFSAVVPLSLLPSTGFDAPFYGFNLWPRIALGDNNQISDFAPDNAMLAAVPEPSTWGLMILGFGLVGGAMRLRQRRSIAYRFG